MNKPLTISGNPPNILIADDDVAIQICLKDIADFEGWDAVFARDGRECYEKFLKKRPDLMIIDHQMPYMTGLELLANLGDRASQVPVIFMSAEVGLKPLHASSQTFHFLKKPFELHELIDLVHSMLTKEVVRQPSTCADFSICAG